MAYGPLDFGVHRIAGTRCQRVESFCLFLVAYEKVDQCSQCFDLVVKAHVPADDGKPRALNAHNLADRFINANFEERKISHERTDEREGPGVGIKIQEVGFYQHLGSIAPKLRPHKGALDDFSE